MRWKVTFAVFLLVLLNAMSSSYSTIITQTVILNGSISLPCSGLCPGSLEWRRHDNKEMVAELDQEVLTTGEGYENRVKLKNGNLSLTISPAEYNDKGWYECVCNNNVLQDVELVVLVPNEKSAHVGDNVKLTCHGSTKKLTPDSEVHVYWEKDGQTGEISPFVSCTEYAVK
uniref:Ig-like domain-containing protein n=1 Tax=Hucho hucho TaxID=62062 RepID=A0A4W5JZ43_9TELE